MLECSMPSSNTLSARVIMRHYAFDVPFSPQGLLLFYKVVAVGDKFY